MRDLWGIAVAVDEFEDVLALAWELYNRTAVGTLERAIGKPCPGRDDVRRDAALTALVAVRAMRHRS